MKSSVSICIEGSCIHSVHGRQQTAERRPNGLTDLNQKEEKKRHRHEGYQRPLNQA